MVVKYKAVKIVEQGYLTSEKGDAVICPIRNANCNWKCAWFSVEGRVIRCQDTIIGALRGEPIRSFRLHTGPDVYNLDESLRENS